MPVPLDNEDKELFLKAKIDGNALGVAGDRDFFRSAGLAPGVSQNLAQLAKDTMGRKSKYSHGLHTDCQLTTSQGTANEPDLRDCPTPPPKEGV